MRLYSKKYVLWIGILLSLIVFALLPTNLGSEKRGLLVESNFISEASQSSGALQTHLYLLQHGSGKVKAHLTKGLFSARTPDLFHDGKLIVFSAKEDESSRWQLYSYDLENEVYEKLFVSERDCLDPVFLPGGGVVFSSPVEVASGIKDLALFRWDPGKEPLRITFTPYSFSEPMILQDGRILALYADSPHAPANSLMVMRPDGTKNALFYKSPEGNEIMGDLLQLDSGPIVFLEKNNTKLTKELVTISYNNPYASRKVLYSVQAETVISLGATEQGKLLLTKKENKEDNGNWFVLNPVSGELEITSLDRTGEIYGPASELRSTKRQRILPSAVKPEEATALLMCQDARITGEDHKREMDVFHGPVEVQGLEQSMGTIELEPDGSFYLKLKADTPFRFQRLDDKGNPLGAPSSWISLRPNERRACVGCHVSNERVPENVQPLAVQKGPLDLYESEMKFMAKSMD